MIANLLPILEIVAVLVTVFLFVRHMNADLRKEKR